MKNKEIKIKKVSTNEVNISERTIIYEIYINGEYETHFTDILDAIDYKEMLEEIKSSEEEI